MNRIHTAEEGHWVNALAPVDINGGKNGDVIDFGKHSHASILILLGVTGAASTVTVTACDDFTPSNETAIPFEYWEEVAAGGDTLSAKKAATASGFATSTNDGVYYVIELEASQVALVDGRTKFRVKFSNPSGSTFGACAVLLSGSRYAGDQNATVIA